MAETSDETQRLKRIAAASYDYDHDSRWSDYWSDVIVPPHLASRPDVLDHFKRQFYHRYIDSDLVVDTVFSSTSSSQPVRPSASLPSTSAQTQAQSSGTSEAAGSNPASQHGDRNTFHFLLNVWVLLVAVFAILPYFPSSLSHQAYGFAVLATACSSLISMYLTCGNPRAWDMEGLEVYFQSVLATKDFIYFIYCLTFAASNPCLKFALIPITCRALEHVAKFFRRHLNHLFLFRKLLVKPCNWVESHTISLNMFSSSVEIGLGFLLIISLFSWQRNFVQTFMYWQVLKLMYHFPATASYHRSSWAKIGRPFNPFINILPRFLLKTPLSAAQKWWVR